MESVDFFSINNNNCYSGKNVLVTGATGGIGSIITEKLVELGANVIATSRSEKRIVDRLSKCVRSKNFDKEIMNFESPKSINRGFKSIMTKFQGKLDILIITHAVFRPGKMQESNINDFDEALNINVRSNFHLISMATPFLKLSKGNVVVLSSQEGEVISSDSFLNSLSKVSRLS